jgi:hypothetical protein
MPQSGARKASDGGAAKRTLVLFRTARSSNRAIKHSTMLPLFSRSSACRDALNIRLQEDSNETQTY